MKDKEVEGFSFRDVFDDSQDCDRENELFRYFEARMTADVEIAFEEHLKACDQCARNLALLQKEADAIRQTSLDPVRANRILDDTRARFAAVLDAEFPAAPGKPRFFDAFRLPAYANALAILLLIALLYPAYRSFVLDRELGAARTKLAYVEAQWSRLNETVSRQEAAIQHLKGEQQGRSEPVLSGLAVYPARAERGAEHKPIVVEFSSLKKSFTLAFAVPEDEFQSFIVEIMGQIGRVWRSEIASHAAGSVLSLHLQADSFADGTYQLRVSGKNGADITLIATYPLKITRTE